MLSPETYPRPSQPTPHVVIFARFIPGLAKRNCARGLDSLRSLAAYLTGAEQLSPGRAARWECLTAMAA